MQAQPVKASGERPVQALALAGRTYQLEHGACCSDVYYTLCLAILFIFPAADVGFHMYLQV